jgi:hypothetical protein
VRSTIFIFITLCTSVKILRENCAQTCLFGIDSAAFQPRRNVAPATDRARPRRAIPPARAPRHVALPEAARPEAGMSPRQLVVRACHVPRRYFPGVGSCPCCPPSTPPSPRPPLCFEAKPPRPARQLAYLRPPSRLARAHDRPAPRALPSRHGRRLGELLLLLTPQSHGLPMPCLGPLGAWRLVCCPAGRRATPGIRKPRPGPLATAARHRHGNPDPNSGLESTEGDPLDLLPTFPADTGVGAIRI